MTSRRQRGSGTAEQVQDTLLTDSTNHHDFTATSNNSKINKSEPDDPRHLVEKKDMPGSRLAGHLFFGRDR